MIANIVISIFSIESTMKRIHALFLAKFQVFGKWFRFELFTYETYLGKNNNRIENESMCIICY